MMKSWLFVVAGTWMAACTVDRNASVYVTSGITDEIIGIDAATGMVQRSIPLDPRRHETDEPHGPAS